MKSLIAVLTSVSLFAFVACDSSSPEDGAGGAGGDVSDGSGASSSNSGGNNSTGGSSEGGSYEGGSNATGGSNEGGSGPELIPCCSFFDCPGTEIQCECGSVSGCNITAGECGSCYAPSDCEAFCANQ